MSDVLVQSRLFTEGYREDAELVAPGIHRLLMGYDNQLMMAKVWFDKGAVGEMHKHPHTQVAYVAAGEFAVTVDGETSVLKAGSSFFVPSEVMHGAVCLEAGILLDVFAPARLDFLGLESW